MPAVYAHDFEKVKTAGTIAVSGQVKGEYGERAFHRVQTYSRRRLSRAGRAKHVSRTNVAAAFTAEVDSAPTSQQISKRHRTHEITKCDGQ